MKYLTTAVVFIVFAAYFNLASSKSLKSYYGNNLTSFKSQRKPLASPVANGIHDNFARSKRQTPKAVQEFQDFLTNAKLGCIKKMGLSSALSTKSLLYEENPTETEKCLISCILKDTKMMNEKKLSAEGIGRIAGNVSNGNPLIVSVAMATAELCNKSVDPLATECEAASQINSCIAREMKARKMKLSY